MSLAEFYWFRYSGPFVLVLVTMAISQGKKPIKSKELQVKWVNDYALETVYPNPTHAAWNNDICK